MAKYAVNEEGVQLLKKSSEEALNSVQTLYLLAKNLGENADEFSAVLGPHYKSLRSSLVDLYTAIKQAVDPIKDLSAFLKDVAEAYQEIINNNFLVPPQSMEPSEPTGSMSVSSFKTLFGKNGNSKSNKFGSFETGEYKNGDSVIKGDNFDTYMADYYAPENSTYESLGNSSYIEFISASSIEGIHLGTSEMNDSGRFWSQHKNDGTKESFIEIASHIPEVRSQLEQGRNLGEIKEDPLLGNCADLYFDPSNMPGVVKSNGYYEFDSNGRHRILAARELGYDIPVRIIGIRRRK